MKKNTMNMKKKRKNQINHINVPSLFNITGSAQQQQQQTLQPTNLSISSQGDIYNGYSNGKNGTQRQTQNEWFKNYKKSLAAHNNNNGRTQHHHYYGNNFRSRAISNKNIMDQLRLQQQQQRQKQQRIMSHQHSVQFRQQSNNNNSSNSNNNLSQQQQHHHANNGNSSMKYHRPQQSIAISQHHPSSTSSNSNNYSNNSIMYQPLQHHSQQQLPFHPTRPNCHRPLVTSPIITNTSPQDLAASAQPLNNNNGSNTNNIMNQHSIHINDGFGIPPITEEPWFPNLSDCRHLKPDSMEEMETLFKGVSELESPCFNDRQFD